MIPVPVFIEIIADHAVCHIVFFIRLRCIYKTGSDNLAQLHLHLYVESTQQLILFLQFYYDLFGRRGWFLIIEMTEGSINL